MSNFNTLQDFGCILHAKWEKHNQDDRIIGKWAEDDSTYEIIVPPQLRDSIINMQNTLSDFYTTTTELQNSVVQMMNTFERIFNINNEDTQ